MVNNGNVATKANGADNSNMASDAAKSAQSSPGSASV